MQKMIGKLRRFLRGWRGELYPFERRILEEVGSRLCTESQAKLHAQVSQINLVQRIINGKEVNLYHMHRDKPTFDRAARFSGVGKEALLSRVTLGHPNNQERLKLELWLIKGSLFSMIYSKPPKAFFGTTSLSAISPKIVDVKICTDPMKSKNIETDRPMNRSLLRGWLQELDLKGQLVETHAPLPEKTRSEFLQQMEAKFPQDYLDLIAQSDGVKTSSCKIYGLSEIRKIVEQDHNSYVLAEIGEHGILTIKEGSQDAELYFTNYQEDIENPVGESLKVAVNNLKN